MKMDEYIEMTRWIVQYEFKTRIWNLDVAVSKIENEAGIVAFSRTFNRRMCSLEAPSYPRHLLKQQKKKVFYIRKHLEKAHYIKTAL